MFGFFFCFISCAKQDSETNTTKCLDYSQYEISEEDFYPPDDKRILKSGVNDIMNGDNFEDYTEYFFGLCEEEEMYESIS